MLINSHLLKSFVAVAESGSVSQAANAIYLTQSAVSLQIKRLEEQLGCAVFERTTRSVKLTAQGEVLLGYARSILTLNEQASLRMGIGRRVSGKVRLGCSDGFIADWMFSVAKRFSARFPAIDLEITLGITTDLAAQVKCNTLDIVVGSRCHGKNSGELLWSEPLVWAFAEHGVLGSKRPIPLALFPEPCPYRESALNALSQRGLDWRIVCCSPSVAGVQAAALAGLAITPLTSSSLVPGLSRMPVSALLPDLPIADFTMQTQPGMLDDGVRELAEDIRSSCRRFSVDDSTESTCVG